MGCIRQYNSALTNQLFWQTHRTILTPCTQGCWRTWAALRRRVASRTNSLDMRSLAPSVMWAQSFSGNSYLPCWMLSNKWLWRENISQYPVKLKGLQNSDQHDSVRMQVFSNVKQRVTHPRLPFHLQTHHLFPTHRLQLDRLLSDIDGHKYIYYVW